MTNVAPYRQPKSRAASGRTQRQPVSRDLVDLARQLEQVKQQAKALGIFTDDRELLECPSCGLLEDVTAEGLLVTYVKDSADLKDCGLRFRPVDEISFECPSCGTKLKAEIL
jgi:predicted RNA-binding Zn-ribbon protein involved in translation (DUF1610 family)